MTSENMINYDEIAQRLCSRRRDALTADDIIGSQIIFVRGQTQIAVASPGATGLRLSGHQALEAFGMKIVLDALFEGAGHFLAAYSEPAKTLNERRLQLGVSINQVARSAQISPETAERAESIGEITPVRELMRYAQALALDERILGARPGANGDTTLGTRLRSLGQDKTQSLTESAVVGLAEAAWVARRQSELSIILEGKDDLLESIKKSSDYGAPTWQRGFELAGQARDILKLAPGPIESIRKLFDSLRIPLIQAELPKQIAGATVANGEYRGVVVNVNGANENVWVRRMTMCHELGHLLWDPAERLNAIKVDDYKILGRAFQNNPDIVEARANAFAIGFLAPPEMVRSAVNDSDDGPLRTVTERFGISRQAAEHHIDNVMGAGFISEHGVKEGKLFPSDEWVGRESYTVDFFPIRSTSVSRRGRFATLVARAVQVGYMTAEAAAMHLQCTASELRDKLEVIASLHEMPE